MHFAYPDGRVIERDVPPIERLDPIVVDGVSLEPVTHDPRWAWYEAKGKKRRAFHREDREHPDELEIDGVTFTRLRLSGRGPAAFRVIDYGVKPGKRGLPVSSSLCRRRPSEGVRDTLHGHQVIRYKDGGYSDLGGRPIVSGVQDHEREKGRTGLDREM